jgi:N-sulfoglucosamine sulfohydrolase
LPDTPECRRELAEYYQAISRLDQGLSALLDALEETGHADDTLVLFLSDNGPPYPGAKTNLYQPGANLPLIVRHPQHSKPQKSKSAKTVDAKVTWADITPTILDYCQVTPQPAPPVRPRENTGHRVTRGKLQPYKFHGRSFLPVLRGDESAGWDEIYASHTFHEITMYYPMRMIIQGRYKYIFNIAHQLPYPFASDLYRSPTWQGVLKRGDEFYGKRTVYAYLHRPRHELYDLKADPHEVVNLANKREHQTLLTDLQSRLKAWQKRTKDPWILKWEYE